jgi:tetratricopeptide (TPR) repeat protein
MVMKFNILIKVLLLGIAVLDQIPTVSAFAFSNQSPKITTRTSLIIPTDKYLKYTNHDIHLFASKEIDSNDDLLNALEESDSSDSLASFRESASSNISSLLSSFSDADSSTGVTDMEGMKEDHSIASPEFTDNFEWDVYICQSKQCKALGSSATLDSFKAMSPSTVQIHPAYLTKTKAKGPNIRCIQRVPPYKAFEVNNVNDVDKVYRILTKHMNLIVSLTARDCLKFTYQGNQHLGKGELTEAIVCYNKALATGYESQEGILLLLRATAYLKRAFEHQSELRKLVADLAKTVPDPADLGRLYQLAAQHPTTLAKPLFNKVLSDTRAQDKKFRQTKYRHGLYEYALLHAAQDSLRSTQLLPHHAKTWLRAGDALAELRKLKESSMYYQKAIDLDPTLKDRLEPVIERLERSQEFLDKAKGWWSSDTLRLALDVAG